jgi:hypothetical protein
VRILREAVNTFFLSHHHQASEGRVETLLQTAGHFAARRHDIAHAIVRDHNWARWRIPPDTRDTVGYFLLPSHYKGDAYDDTALPIYAYTANSMEALRHQLMMLETEAMGVAALLVRMKNEA